MTYQCFSGAGIRVSVVTSVISAQPAQQGQALGEDEVEDRDEDAHGEADDEHEHRQVDRLLAGRPGDLLQLGPRFVEISTETLDHGSDAFFMATDVGGDGRRGRTRTDNHWFWRPELCQIELRASAGSLLRLPVEGVTAVTRTILPKLEPAWIVLLVLARGVGPLLALGAGEQDHRAVLSFCHRPTRRSR